jgi:hypothetical protein
MKVLLATSLFFSFIFTFSDFANARDESIILYFSFDKQSGKTVVDESGNGNDGTLKGNVKWEKNGQIRGAVSFDRSPGTYIEVPDNKALDSLTESTTMEAWVKTNVNAGGFGDDQIMGKYANPKPNETTIMFISCCDYGAGQGGAKVNGFGFETSPTSGWDGSSWVVGSKTLPKAGQWYHVAGTLDHKTGIIKIYVNGKLDGERNIKAKEIGTNDQPFAIGGNPGNNNRWFDGMIDEVVIYNRPLTEAEIERDMSGVAPVEIGDKATITWGSIKRKY